MESRLYPSSHYHYAPLPSQFFIRVVQVNSIDDKGQLQCTINTIPDLKSYQNGYRCLSYTWGNPFREADCPAFEDTRHVIKCNAGILSITENLYNALCALFKIFDGKLDSLWIDAISINQTDETEKTAQVSIMHEIYKSADSVIPWLGPKDDNLDPVLQVMTLLDEHEMANPGFFASMENMTIEEAEQQQIPDISVDQWISCQNFFCRRYFERLWVFQEVVGARRLNAICGEQKVSWEGLMRTSKAWTILGTPAVIRGMKKALKSKLYNAPHRLSRLRERYMKEGDLRKEFGYLVLHLNRNDYSCGEPKDRIYAHVGICGYSRILPDYSKSIREVYTEFWSGIMLRMADINLLSQVEDASCRSEREVGTYPHYELPSWVPDLHSKQKPRSLYTHYNSAFNVSNGLSTEMVLKITQDCLSLNGYLIDQIEGLSECTGEIDFHHSISHLLDLIKSLPKEYPSGGDSMEALWRTMAILVDFPTYPPPDDNRLKFKLWMKQKITDHKAMPTMKSKHNDRQNELLEGLPPSNILPSAEEVEVYASNYIEFWKRRNQAQKNENSAATTLNMGPFYRETEGHVGMSAIAFGDQAFMNMRLFRTKGNFVGKGPQSMRAEDELWIFPGAEVLFLLRKAGPETWNLVGHAYVHGMMHGEAVKDLQGREPVHVNIV